MQVEPFAIYTTVGLPVIAPLSLSFYLHGVGILQARMVMVMYILFLVAAFYIFASEAWSTRIATWSTLLLVSFAPLYGNGKNVLGEVPGLFFFFLMLYFVARLERQKDADLSVWIGAGFSAGLFMATKPNFILLAPVLGLALFIQQKRSVLPWKKVILMGGAVVIPLIGYIMSLLASGISLIQAFGSYANMPGLQQVTGLTLSQLVLKNALLFFQQATPIYLLAVMIVWTIYLGIRFKQKRSIPLHEIIAFGFAILTMAYFLKMPGWFRYLFVAQVIAFPYFVIACTELISFLNAPLQTKRLLRRAIPVALFAIILFQVYQVLFSSFVAGYYQNTRTKELTAYFHQLDPAKHIFIYHAPEIVTFISGENYSQYMDLVYFATGIGKSQLKNLEDGIPDLVIVSGDELEKAQKFLSKYQKQMMLDNGSYTVFERKEL